MSAHRMLRPRTIVLTVIAAFGLFLAGFGYGQLGPDERCPPPPGPPPVEGVSPR